MEKEGQSRSVSNVVSPIRYLGKKYLSYRSNFYKESLAVIIKADNIFRDVVRKQNNYLKAMKKNKSNLEAVLFAQNVMAFMREQTVLIGTAAKIRDEFANIVGIESQNLRSIDYYISSEIGRKPKYNPNQIVEDKIDLQNQWEMERPSSLGRWLQYYTKPSGEWVRLEGLSKAEGIENHPELISQAFLASWFWGRTESGKSLKKAFEDVYSSVFRMHEANINLLKSLDDLRSQGDAQAYWIKATKDGGFGKIYKKYAEDGKFLKSWQRFEDMMTQSQLDQDIQPERTEEQTGHTETTENEDIGYEPESEPEPEARRSEPQNVIIP